MKCSTPGCSAQRGLQNSGLCNDCHTWVLEYYDKTVNTDQGYQGVEGRGDLATGGTDHQQAGSRGQPYKAAYNCTHQMMPNDADDISSNAVYESDTGSISDASTGSAIFVPSRSQPTQARPVAPTLTTASPPPHDSLPHDLCPHRSQTPTLPSEMISPLVSHMETEDMVARQQDDTQPALSEDSVAPAPPTSARTDGEGTEDDSTQEEEGRHGPDPSERYSPTPPTPSPPPETPTPTPPPEMPTPTPPPEMPTPTPPLETPTPTPPPEPIACLSPMCNRLGDAEHHNFCPVCYNTLLQHNAGERPHPPPPYHSQPPPFPGRQDGPEALLTPPAHSAPRNDSRNSTVYQNSQVHFHGCNIIFQ